MAEEKTLSISTDPVFLEELSEYLEVLASPLRLKILKFIESEPREITAIADHVGMTYQNTKKHVDRLVSASLVKRTAGFGRETDRGIAPVWKYSLTGGSLENITRTLGIFSSIAAPVEYSDIRKRIRSVKSELEKNGNPAGPVLYAIGGAADGQSFLLKNDRVFLGRVDPDHPPAGNDPVIALPEEYRAVTRVTKPHAVLIRTTGSWQIEDNASTGGTFLNSRRLEPLKRTPLASGDVIDLSVGANGARLLFIADE
jgi:DNA-binding transcriptional ArsR family regulator